MPLDTTLDDFSMPASFRLAHLSDLHFSHPELSFSQLFDKRWIGNLNFLLRRKKTFDYSLLDSLPALLKRQGVQLVLISGDLTCTSSEKEFALASHFLARLKEEGLETVLIPGNHDHYTKEADQKKMFYQFFPSVQSDKQWDLKKHKVCARQLLGRWWLLLLDTTLATPLLCSYGKFSEELEKNLREVLGQLPSDAHVVLANHFPLEGKKCRTSLQRNQALFELLRAHPQIKLYLHGHDHQHRIVDLRGKKLPIAVDAGSATLKTQGSWVLMDCEENGCRFTSFLWDREGSSWAQAPHSTSFTW